MARSVRKALRKCALAAAIAIAGAACLGTLPDPTECPAPAVYPTACILPNDPTVPCDCPGRDCSCSAEQCARSNRSCYPPPDCPPAVRRVAPSAQCLEANPSQDLSDLSACSCGCLACATACDGEGIVWGPQQTLAFALPSGLPGSGSLGLMLRARGSGTVTVELSPPLSDGTSPSLDPVTLTPDFADWTSTSMYSWTSTSGRPTSIQLVNDAQSSAEVDCAVPYLAP